MDGVQARRLALNETTFRSLNEKIAELTDGVGLTHTYEFVCECATSDCFERVQLTRAQYEEVRKDGAHFFLVPGHEDTAIEHVVAQLGRYVIVEKDGTAGTVARDEDPRS